MRGRKFSVTCAPSTLILIPQRVVTEWCHLVPAVHLVTVSLSVVLFPPPSYRTLLGVVLSQFCLGPTISVRFQIGSKEAQPLQVHSVIFHVTSEFMMVISLMDNKTKLDHAQINVQWQYQKEKTFVVFDSFCF